MGNLQQVVERLDRINSSAVGVFEVQTAVLLDVKALVFNLETNPSAVVGQGRDVLKRQAPVGNPGVSLSFALAGFLTQQRMQGGIAAFRIGVFQIIGPAERLM